MPKPLAVVKYQKCVPEKSSSNDGIYEAIEVCTHHILIQEESYDSPMVFPVEMCQGCGDCVHACSLDVILLVNI